MARKVLDFRTDSIAAFADDLGGMAGQVEKRGDGHVEDITKRIVKDARRRAKRLGGSTEFGGESLKARKGVITGGGRGGKSRRGRQQEAFWGAEFGSRQYAQFRAWRGNQWTPWAKGNVGYFLHPAIRSEEEAAFERMGDDFDDWLD